MNATCFTFPTTVPGRATWAANPTCRGTFEIITLCLSTTIICIWSSIHNDIPAAQPPPKALGRDIHTNTRIGCIRVVLNAAICWLRQKLSGILRILRNKGPTVVVAFFCPALLLMRAIDQYSSASNFRDLANDRDKKGNQFTIVHGFYATMGGFQLDVLDSRSGEAFEDTTFAHTRLSTKGAFFFMRNYPDLLAIPSIEAIKERAKSNSLGKAVLALQVVWFIVNCASRLAESLPLSLMEVSTLAHGLCTLLTYFAWWSKPLNIEGPTKLKMEIKNKRRALESLKFGPDDVTIARWKRWVQFFDSHLGADPSESVEELFKSLPVDASLVDDPDAQARELAKDLKFLVDILRDRDSRELREGPTYRKLLYLAGEAEHAGSGEISKDEVLDGVRTFLEEYVIWWRLREAAYTASERSQTTPIAMALLDIYHFTSFRKNPQDINIFDLLQPKSSTNPRTNAGLAVGRGFSEHFLHETSPTFHDLLGAFALTTKSEVRAIDYVSLSVTPVLYGSLHLLGWWKQFPSSAEQIIWRVATTVAMSSGLFAAVICSFYNTILRIKLGWRWFGWDIPRWNDAPESWSGRLGKYVVDALLRWIIPTFYVLSSTFLIVESIRQLWFLPSEAYIVATWSYYFPHLF